MKTKAFRGEGFKKCKVCGKRFNVIFALGWGYSIRKYPSSRELHYFCSYSCMREFERTQLNKRLKGEKKVKAV